MPQLALITAAIVPVIAWLTSRYGGRMTRNWQALFGRVGDFNAGSRRMSAACASCRPSPTRSTSGALFAHDNASYRETKLDAYRIMAASKSLSYMGMRLIQLVVMVAGSYLVMRANFRMAASSASCCWSACSSGRSTRSTR